MTRGSPEVSLSRGTNTHIHSSLLGNFEEDGTPMVMDSSAGYRYSSQLSYYYLFGQERGLLNSADKIWARFPIEKINLEWQCHVVVFTAAWILVYILHGCAVKTYNIQKGFSWLGKITCREVVGYLVGWSYIGGHVNHSQHTSLFCLKGTQEKKGKSSLSTK